MSRKRRSPKRKINQPLDGSTSTIERILLIAFFFSGATSLALEVVWSKELSYLLGVDIYAATTVVAAFMAGLGLGAVLVVRFFGWIKTSIRTYAYLQLVIGLCGAISIPLFRATPPFFAFLYRQFDYQSSHFLLLRFIVVFVLMLLPVTVMGMTLPVVVGAAWGKSKSRYAHLAGRLYGVNTVGAVTGTLTTGFILVPWIGLLKTCLAVGLIDFLIGIILLRVSTSHEPSEYRAKPKERISDLTMRGALLASAGVIEFFSWPSIIFLVSGIAALSYEIVWFRLLARIVGPTVHAFSIMLAVYLFGIGCGSLFGAHFVRRQENYRLSLSVLSAAIGFSALFSLFFINELPLWYADLFIKFTTNAFTIRNLVIQWIIASFLILPTTFFLGAFFPMVIRAHHQESSTIQDRTAPAVGTLYFFNTIGAVIGSLVTGFWLIPAMGIKGTVFVASGINVIVAIFLYRGTAQHRKRIGNYIPGFSVAAGFILIVCFSPAMDQTLLNAGLFSQMVNQSKFLEKLRPQDRRLGDLIYYKEGINASVAVMANKFHDGNLTMHLNGTWVSSTEIHGRLHLEFLGHLPLLFARDAETVGVIGFGTGITSGNILLYPTVKRVNIFELEPGVIQASRYFEFVNQHPLQDPRTHMYMMDGRSHITFADFQYDAITSDPIHPFVAGSGNLYSCDFYKIAAAHLKPGGIFCQWAPLAGISTEAYNTILNSLHHVFPHVAVFSFFGESVIIASQEPIQANWNELENKFYHPSVYPDFQALDFQSPFNLLAFFIGAERQIDTYLQSTTRTNTDDNVWLEHRMPFDFFTANRRNLYFMLKEKIPDDGGQSIRQIFKDIPFARLGKELAALAKDGDTAFQAALDAEKNKDLKTMEKYLKMAYADLNATHNYDAGIRLAELLGATHRTSETLSVLKTLQTNFPAFPKAYIAEIELWIKTGDIEKAHHTLERGLAYNPNSDRLIAWNHQIHAYQTRNGSTRPASPIQ